MKQVWILKIYLRHSWIILNVYSSRAKAQQAASEFVDVSIIKYTVK
jgi:hypothetical protein